ncbi:hypothetical protein TWF281_005733 [Arthrobotrys megalospora]
MSSQQSPPPPHQGPPLNRNQPPSSASRSISPHKRARTPDFSREPPKGPRAYLTHQGGPPAGGAGNSGYGGRAPPGPRGRSPPPLGPRSRTTVGPLSAGTGMSPVNDSYNAFRDRPPRDYDDYRNRPSIPPRMRDGPPGNGIERRQSIGGPMGGPYPRRTSPPRRSRSPPERRGWNDRIERYPREDFRGDRDNREDYFARNAREDRHFQREGHPRETRERDYSYSSSYRPEPREPYNNTREFHHRQSISSQGLPIVSPVDDPNKLAREQREREAAEYKKRRTVGPRPNDPPERKRSTHTRSPSPTGQHQATHSPPHTVSSRYTSNPSPSTNSPPPLSDRNNERTLSDTPFKSDNQPPQSATPQTPHPPHTPSTFQRNLTRPTHSVPILSAPAPPSVPSFRDIPLGPRALSNSSLRTIPTGPRVPPTGPRWDKDKKDGDKDDSGTLIKEEPHDKTIDDKPPIDEPSPVEEGEVVNSGDERSFEGDNRDIEMENAKDFRKESSVSESRFDRALGPPASYGATDTVETKKDVPKETLVKEAPLLKEPTEPKTVPQDKRPSTGSENAMRDQPSLSASPTTKYPPTLPSPSTESSKSVPLQPAHFPPTSPSQPSQILPLSVPTGPRFGNQSGRGGGGTFWGPRRGNMMAPGPFGRGVGSAPYSIKREEEERRPGLWNSGRGNMTTGLSGRAFVPSGPAGHFNRSGQPFTSPKLTNAELRAGRAPSVDSVGNQNLEKGQETAGVQATEGPSRPLESQDVEMEDAPQSEPLTTTLSEPNVKQESPVDTKSSPDNVKTETPNEDDDALTSSDVTKRIEEIDQRIGAIESQLNVLDTRKQSKQVELEQMDLQEAETAARTVREREAETAEPKPATEDDASTQNDPKQDSLSPSLAAEFAAQSMDDKPRLPGPMDSSPEPEQPSTPKMLHDLAPIVKEDEDMMVTDVKEEPSASTKETFDTSSLPYFIAGRQREPVEYEFWNANISQHSKVENLIAKHLLERKAGVEEKALKLRQEYRDHLPSWKQDCEKLDSEEKRKKKSDSEPADAAPAEAVPAAVNLEVSGTASLGRRSGRGVSSDFVSSEYEIERIMKLSEKEEAEKAEAEAKEKYDDSREAVVPDMILDPEEKIRLLYVDTNNIITDKSAVKGIFKFERPPDNWTEEEQKLFKERFAQFPKQWGKIALGIDGRDYKACILHYYQTKQQTPYKDLVRPAKATRRRKPGRNIAITNARTTRARASAASALGEIARRGTPLDDEDVDSEDVPTVGRPRRAAAPVFGDNDDNATPGPSGKRQAGAKPSINVEDVSTPTPAEKPAGKRRGGPKADKEKKEKSASRGRTPNATPASEKAEKAIKNKGELLQTPQELNALGALANMSAAASGVLTGLPSARGFGQELIQPAPPLKQEPGTKLEDDIGRLQPPFVTQPYLDAHNRIPMSTAGMPQPEIVPSRPIVPGRRPGAPGGRGRKAAQVDEDGVVIAPVTSSYWSVPETQDFPQLLASFGTNFEAIAEHLGTKTTTMVRNNYQRGCEQGKDYQRIAEEANRKISNGEAVPHPPPPILPSSKRRYDNSNSQANRAVQAQPVDPDTEMIDPGARKQPQRLPPQGTIFPPNRTVAVGPEARIPAQIQSKPGPKPGTFKETRPSARPPVPFVQSATGIEDYRPVIPPRVPLEPSGKTPAQAIQISDIDEVPSRQFPGSQASHQRTIDLEYERRQRQQGIQDPRVMLQQQQEHLARQEQAAQSNKMAQQQPPRQPQAVQALHAQTHPTQIAIQEQPGTPRFDPRDPRNDPRDSRPQDQYRAQPHLQDLVKQEPREKRLSGEKLVPMPGLGGHPVSHAFPEDKRPRSPPIQRHRSPQVSAQAASRTVSDPVVSKMVLGPTYKDDRSPPRIPIEQTQGQPHLMHVQQQAQPPTHRRHDSGNHNTPPAIPPPSQQQHLRTASSSRPPYPPTQQASASAPAPSQQQQQPQQQQPPPPPPPAPAPPSAPSKSAGFSLASILNEPEEPPRPTARPSNETWFGTSSSSSSYTARDPPAPQRPQPEPVSHYNSPSLSAAVPHAFGRHSPTPSEPLYHSQRPPSSVPLPQGPVSGTMFQKTYPPAQTRTPPPRSTSHPNYPPQQPPPHSQVSSGPPVSSYHEHPPRHHAPPPRDPGVDPRVDPRDRDPRDHFGQYPSSRQHQFSPPNYQSAYPPPSSQAPPPIHREPIERIHPDRTMHPHPHHIQTQQPGGYPPPPPQQYHPSRPGEQQGPPSLMQPSGFYDYSRPRQMDSHERGNR